MRVWSLHLEDSLEKEMATDCSALAWRILWTEEPGGLQSIASQSQTRLKRLSTHTKEKGATEAELVVQHHQFNGHESEQTPGDNERQGSLACCSPCGRKQSDMT